MIKQMQIFWCLANNYTDVYIINKDSHNIFYAQGVGIKQNDITKIYYTD